MNRYDKLMKKVAMCMPHLPTEDPVMQFVFRDATGRSLAPRHVPEEAMEELESQLGSNLPLDYREFLQDYGGVLVANSLPLSEPTGDGFDIGMLNGFYAVISDGLDNQSDLLGKNVGGTLPQGLLVIAFGENGYWCLEIAGENNGAVYFWDSRSGDEFEHMRFIAPSFDAFMHLLAA